MEAGDMSLLDALIKTGLVSRDPEPEPLHPHAPAATEPPAQDRKEKR